MADKKFNLKDQLAGIAALIAAIVAIGGGFVKYGEITTKLAAIEAREQVVVDTSSIESSIAVLQDGDVWSTRWQYSGAPIVWE